MFTVLPFLLALQAQAPEPLKGTDLKPMVGPMAPRYPDPAGGMGSDRTAMRMRRACRQGRVPAVEVPPDTPLIADQIRGPEGWRAYRVQVPGRASVQVRLQAEHEAWFRLTTVNRWGRMEEGMLQNRIYRGRPEATYTNPKDTACDVFFIVDTTSADFVSDAYTLEITWK